MTEVAAHHVEATLTDFTRTWGWHCLTCNATASGFRGLAAAEADAAEHGPQPD